MKERFYIHYHHVCLCWWQGWECAGTHPNSKNSNGNRGWFGHFPPLNSVGMLGTVAPIGCVTPNFH